jgi:hypothetical protein
MAAIGLFHAFLVPEIRNPAASPAFDDANSSHWQISMTR